MKPLRKDFTMKSAALKAGKHLKSNAKGYIVVVSTVTLAVITYGALTLVSDMEDFLRDKDLLEEYKNQS